MSSYSVRARSSKNLNTEGDTVGYNLVFWTPSIVCGVRDGEIWKRAAEPADTRMAGRVLRLRRAQERLEAHQAATDHGADLHSHRIFGTLALFGVHRAWAYPLSHPNPNRPQATRLHALYFASGRAAFERYYRGTVL